MRTHEGVEIVSIQKRSESSPEVSESRSVSRVGRWCHFLRAAWVDARRHKCHYMVAVLTILLIVLSFIMVQSLIQRGPVIFLNLAQLSQGEVDAYISPTKSQFINFTALTQVPGGYKVSP